MNVVVHLAPRFDAAAAVELARTLYGLNAAARPLSSERDQNFHLTDASGDAFVLKIANATEPAEILDFQNRALDHLAAQQTTLGLPRLCRTLDDRTMAEATGPDGREHFVRLLTWVPGIVFAEVRPHDERLLESLGRRVADMDRALADFSHPAMHRYLRWDLKQASWIRDELPRIRDTSLCGLVERFLDRFERTVAPRLATLGSSVIHNDWNDYNVLVSPSGDATREVIGAVDFGDMVRTHTVCDLAIAATYAMLGKADPIAAAAAVVRGYHSVRPLAEDEVAVIFDLIALRVSASIAMAACQHEAAPDNDYLQISQAWAVPLLARLAATSPPWAYVVFRHACGFEPCPHGAPLRRWLAANRNRFARLSDEDLATTPPVVFDLSVGSRELPDVDEAHDATRLAGRLFARMASAGAQVGIGRYDEARLGYSSDVFTREGNDGPEWRTVHIGIDLFVAPGASIYAPLDGVVHSIRNNANPLDYGPTIILEHHMDEEPGVFYTLYGHLTLDSIEGVEPGTPVGRGDLLARVGDTDVNGGWPPHLHVQVIADLLDHAGDFPGVALPRERDIWLSLCPNPAPLVGLSDHQTRAERTSQDDLRRRRRAHIGPSLSISYRRPLTIVRGHRQLLYDDEGRRFLDAVNNVPHVGHSHPRVVKAAAEQMAVLTTTTRYLHESLVRYAERLTALLPASLRVCYVVNSGSEANELALRLARAHTGRTDVLVVDHAYHGNTSALVDISPYKFDGPGGGGAPPWVHKVPMPDPYRGHHRGSDAGARYADEVRAVVERVSAEGRAVAAFFCESLSSCGGQIVLPEGYLAGAYAAVRQAGGVCVADEVQVGFGRVGTHLWGFETQGVVPDILTLGKPMGNGFPLGAVVTTPGIAASFPDGMEYFNTYGGSPVACAVGLAVLDVLEEEGLQQHARDVGSYLKAGLARLKARFPIVGDVRGLGLFLGVELVTDRERRLPAPRQASYVINRLRDRGILTSTDGPNDNVIKIKPPMVFTKRDADELLAALEVVLAEDLAQTGH